MTGEFGKVKGTFLSWLCPSSSGGHSTPPSWTLGGCPVGCLSKSAQFGGSVSLSNFTHSYNFQDGVYQPSRRVCLPSSMPVLNFLNCSNNWEGYCSLEPSWRSQLYPCPNLLSKIPYSVFSKKIQFYLTTSETLFRVWSKCLIELKIKLKGNPRQQIGYGFQKEGLAFTFQRQSSQIQGKTQLFRDKHYRITIGLKNKLDYCCCWVLSHIRLLTTTRTRLPGSSVNLNTNRETDLDLVHVFKWIQGYIAC